MSDLDGIVKEFLVESYENLDRLDRDLVELEKDPHSCERLSSIFRTIHTIKGTCGFFGFGKLESVTHVGENLLSRLRDGILLLDPERTSALLALVDAVRLMLGNIEKTGNDGNGDYQELIDRLTLLQEARASYHRTEQSGALEPAASVTAPSPDKALWFDGDRLQVLEEKEFLQPQDIRDAFATPPETKSAALTETSIRVDVALIDKLMNLVGELVLARNQILQFNSVHKDTAFLKTTHRLNLITTELQEGVMKTRMQPIGNIWNRYPRIVRDLAVTCGKEVQLDLEGAETELDKTIIEAIKDPLTHIVRNSVDHGIEKPEIRRANGKPAIGMLRLRAFHEGGQVNIEIIDDGAGVNTERVKARAIERNLITREQADRMSDREATHLLFLPGFSTAEKVTNVSGRGVGMDVVKTNIEKIGGTVDLQSQPGQGTTLKIKIPLTLAIIPALIVTSGGDRFAIPQVSLLELVRLEGEQAKRGIENIHGAPVYRLRGNLLPLVYLDHELKQDRRTKDLQDNTINIVVLQTDERQFGLIVEKINDTEEIVVKPLGNLLKGISTFAGATIMGDGRVALILDVLGIAQKAGVVTEVRERTPADHLAGAKDSSGENQALLVLSIGKDRRGAIPLSLVARLEEIPAKNVEWANNQEVVQYRGQILSLIRLSTALGIEANEVKPDLLQVVVFAERGRSVGLVVDHINDIVETPLEVRREVHRSGILTSTVIQDRVTDLLDVHGIIRSTDSRFLESPVAF